MDTILLIEYNRDVRENISEILELGGFTVVAVAHGKLGYEIAKNIKPSLVICDVLLSTSEGTMFINLAKENPETSGIPLLLMSAGNEPLDILRLYVMGADAYVNKPFTGEQLLDSVRKLLLQNALK